MGQRHSVKTWNFCSVSAPVRLVSPGQQKQKSVGKRIIGKWSYTHATTFCEPQYQTLLEAKSTCDCLPEPVHFPNHSIQLDALFVHCNQKQKC